MADQVRVKVNQQVQVGPESMSARGTPVACGKLLDAFTWTFGAKPTTKQFRGSGQQYPTESELLMEYAAGKVTGPLDFSQVTYLLSSLYGTPTPALHSPSTTAYDWIWMPPLVGSYAVNAQSLTVQEGDAVDCEQYAFLVLTGFGYSFTRKQEAAITGDWMSQTLLDGATLTATPTAVGKIPATGAQFNLYLDSASAGLGTTLLTAAMKVAFAASGFYDGQWPINRANSSFTNILDKEKKQEFKFTLEANAAAFAIKAAYLNTGALAYIRVDGQGSTIDGTNSIKAEFIHDMAVFVSSVGELSVADEVYALEFTCTVAGDSAWSALTGGTAQVLTLTNLLAAL